MLRDFPAMLLILGGMTALVLAQLPPVGASQIPAWVQQGQEPLDSASNHHHGLTTRNETIYEILSSDKQYSKLIKAINYVDEIVSILNDSSARVTFFATPDKALRRPHKNHYMYHHKYDDSDGRDLDELHVPLNPTPYDLSDTISHMEKLEAFSLGEQNNDIMSVGEKKKFLKKVLRAILSYHILPLSIDADVLADTNTYATNLVLPSSLGSRPLRIRVTRRLLHRTPIINLFSKIVRSNLHAKNGIVHGINHPLLPPPSVFQELYMAPSFFSTFTSAIQRAGLTDTVDLRYVRAKHTEKGSLKGTSSVTVFAPSNRAFEALPRRLQLFLFSPVGAGILKKLLQYHIVPGLVVHSDYIYNKSSDTASLPHLGPPESFAITEIGCHPSIIHECAYPIRYDDIKNNLLFSEDDIGAWLDDDIDYHSDDTNFDAPGVSGFLAPGERCAGPTKLNSEENEALSEEDEALSEERQNYISRYLESHDPLADDDGDILQPDHRFQSSRGPLDEPLKLCHPDLGIARYRRLAPPIPVSEVTLPTLLTNRSLSFHVVKYNITLPLPGPHKPYNIVTKVTADDRAVFFPDLTGLNGAVHVIGRLLDPRRPRHALVKPEDYDEDEGPTWEDWEEWLPQWAAKS